MNRPPLTPNVEKIISVMPWVLLISGALAGCLAYGGLEWFGVKGWVLWSGVLAITYPLTRIINAIILYFVVVFIYKGDYEQITKEAIEMEWVEADELPQQEQAEVQMTVVSVPDKPIGHYLDAEIFEWIEFSRNGQLIMARFADTISPKQQKTFEIPDEHALFPPGILYKLEPKQVEETNK